MNVTTVKSISIAVADGKYKNNNINKSTSTLRFDGLAINGIRNRTRERQTQMEWKTIILMGLMGSANKQRMEIKK